MMAFQLETPTKRFNQKNKIFIDTGVGCFILLTVLVFYFINKTWSLKSIDVNIVK